MTKNEVIRAIAEKSGLPLKSSAAALDAILATISDALVAGDKVHLPGFGTFEVKSREARTGRNPRTNETISIPASRQPAFKASKSLKDKLF